MVTCPPNTVTQSTSVRLTGTPQDALCRPITSYPNRWLPPPPPSLSTPSIGTVTLWPLVKQRLVHPSAVLMGVGVASTELCRDGVPSLLEYPCAPKQEHFTKV